MKLDTVLICFHEIIYSPAVILQHISLAACFLNTLVKI